uniref:Hermansky-Pudlak syndrome 5 protein homolog n=1 Tax=Salvator merianae TaxID=96440 RepID=A0A8D0C6Q9_SALMN
MASVSMISESCSHVLAELECLAPLLSALRLDSSRLKCTCVAVSRKWLALGSSGGGLNLVQKDCWKQRLFLTHKEGAISRAVFCVHDEDYIAVATSQGLIVVWELNQERRGKPERIYVSSEHRGRKITALCWDTTALRVFVGDHVGKVSAIRLNTSKQGKATTAFVMFPVQIITTVDSRVVQLDYLDGRLLISSLTRSYLCDTEREKFWKIGNKERDGEYGSCFFPIGKTCGTQQSLIYCARPGSRMWEVNFEGEVLSTHQFKQLLSSPPLPIITLRDDLEYNVSASSPQSLAFPKLLYLSDHCVMTWTERGIYIFIPQNVQVLLWSEVKDIHDIAIYKNELYCLHTNGKVSHMSLLPVERCIERLLRRNLWTLAARICCLFQNSIVSCRSRKVLPVDKLEHLKSQLDISSQRDIIAQLEDLISKLEPLDSACSSRRSSISSHESFSVLDSGIYRVISRRGSQSDEDSCSLHSQTLSEDERLKEFHTHQEEEQLELGNANNVSHASVVADPDRNETFLPFNIPLSFRSPSPLVSLQAVKDSVSSFVRKTTEKIEKIGTLHTTPERIRQDVKDEEQLGEVITNMLLVLVLVHSSYQDPSPAEYQLFFHYRMRLQDPTVLLQPPCLRAVLLDWIPFLEDAFAIRAVVLDDRPSKTDTNLPLHPGEQHTLEESVHIDKCCEITEKEQIPILKTSCENDSVNKAQEDTLEENISSSSNDQVDKISSKQTAGSEGPFNQSVQISSPYCIAQDIQKDLTELTTLCFELKIYECLQVNSVQCTHPEAACELACRFIKDYFFLLDLERLKKCIINCHSVHPKVWEAYVEGLKINKFISRLPFLRSLLHPESLRLDWLSLAVSYDAPHKESTVDAQGDPRPRSHFFTWGYNQLILLLLKLPADTVTKEKMSVVCKSYGFWPGYLSLCLELERRVEALTVVVHLDDMNLLDRKLVPETLEEWKFLLCLVKNHENSVNHLTVQNGTAISNGSSNCSSCITVENVALLLARVTGPDRALQLLQECGLKTEISEKFTKVCEILRIAEKRQRALIQSMLERCDRFLWSQQA